MERIERWLSSEALPLWSDAGCCDATGAFFESVSLAGAPRPEDERRVRVQFRQMFVFSHAFHKGFAPQGLEKARRGFEYVQAAAWAPDGRPGWCHKLDQQGRVLDGKRDCYDHAFALFGLAWYYRASADPRALLAIRQTVAFLDEHMKAENGGWLEDDANTFPRRQNPHMHSFEASLALYQATGDEAFLARAAHCFELFRERFFDRKRHVVLEYFERDWTPLQGDAQRVEPGHMAEWVWLLREYAKVSGENVDEFADPLFEKMLKIGFDDDDRFLIDELSLEGEIVKETRRLWPQTELLKAAVAQVEAGVNKRARRLAERTVEAIFDEYLGGCVDGGWIDKFDLKGRPLNDRVPASTLYHLYLALICAMETLPEPQSDPRAQRLDGAMIA